MWQFLCYKMITSISYMHIYLLEGDRKPKDMLYVHIYILKRNKYDTLSKKKKARTEESKGGC